jgi:hypothetical protein
MDILNSKLYKQNCIIEPPTIKQTKLKKKQIRVIIDSRDRNINNYNEPNKYTISLDTPINDVVSLQLVDYYVPFSRSLINNTNKTLKYSTDNGTTTKTIDLTEGEYSGADLATELKSKLGSDINTVTYSSNTEKITFNTNNNNFILKFSDNDKNNLYSVLGFSIADYTSSNLTIISPYIVNLDIDNYIIMHLENAITNISNNDTINKSFAIIKTQILPDEVLIKNFNPPLNNFSKFIIEFNDYYGNLYQFNGKEHRLEFIIETLNRPENVFT